MAQQNAIEPLGGLEKVRIEGVQESRFLHCDDIHGWIVATQARRHIHVEPLIGEESRSLLITDVGH
jgi:hypothetical protein